MADGCRFASIPFRWIYVTGIVVVLFCGIQETLSARGARIGGGFRSSSSRYSVRMSSNVRYVSSTRVRVRYNNNYRPWRSWHSYGSSGYIYGYVYYTRSRHYHSHRDREPTICRNEYDNLMDNGTHYEWFICPNMTSPDNYDACCGDEDRQHCCQSGSNGLRVFGIVVGAFILLFGFVVTIYCCCMRKATGRDTYFRQRFMSKHLANPAHPPSAAVHYRADHATGKSGNASEITHLVNPPMQGPQPTFPQNDQPGYPPPPSIQTTYPPQPLPDPSGYANSGYPPSGGPGASCAPPYPPYPGASPYPPASDQPLYPVQPPLGDGSGYIPSASAPPYPPYPADGSSAPPYPPYPTGGSSAPPYPHYPTDGSSAPPYPPYPMDGNSTPCPPYPADGGAAPPYPPQPAAYNPPGYPGNPPPTYSNLQ